RNDDQAASGFVQSESDIAKIRVRYVLQFRQRACGPDADHRAASIKAPVQRFDSRSGLRFAEGDVDGGKDTAGEREQVRGENDLRFAQTSVVESLRRVAV